MTGATISRIERGEQPYTQETVEAIAFVLDCEPSDLLDRDPLDEAERELWLNLKKMKSDEKERALRIFQAITGDERVA